MLNPENNCRLPIGPLQPNQPIHEVMVPMADVDINGDIDVGHGYRILGYYDVQNQVWRVSQPSGEKLAIIWREGRARWTTGSLSEWQSIRHRLPAPEGLRSIQFPPIPVIPLNALPIPRTIHQLWIGTAIPSDVFFESVARNGRHTEDFTSFLHTDVSDELFITLTDRFRTVAPNLVVTRLQDSPFFQQFRNTRLYPHYQNASTAPHTNYSAASDMLRYPLINYHGGVYIDMDDYFLSNTTGMPLNAAPNDLLLGSLTTKADADFEGFNSSHFASHANNPVLARITEEMTVRCEQAPHFFNSPRQENIDASGVDSHAVELFHLTGPQVLNDVLALERPDYYNVGYLCTERHGPTSRIAVYDQVYTDNLIQILAHYFPFNLRMPIFTGYENTWKHS